MSVCYVPHGNGDTLFTRLERDARAAFRAGVLAADPGKAVRDALAYRDGALSVRRRDGSWRCDPWACVRPVAVGKAALGMLEAALDVMAEGGDTGVSGDVLGGMRGLAVTNLENARPIDGVEVVAAGHPLPDEHSVRGGGGHPLRRPANRQTGPVAAACLRGRVGFGGRPGTGLDP